MQQQFEQNRTKNAPVAQVEESGSLKPPLRLIHNYSQYIDKKNAKTIVTKIFRIFHELHIGFSSNYHAKKGQGKGIFKANSSNIS